MARRMFSPEIVESEDFLSLPISSQALYFHLAMNADDDGFIQPQKIMRMVGSSTDDLKVLIAKRFVLVFQTGVVVIKHWLIHNLIRADRYKETRFTEEKKAIKIKENKAYTELGCQNDNQTATQVRLGKVRLGNNNTISEAKPHRDKFETNKYPKTDYTEITEAYKRIKQVEPQGKEWLPIQAEIKRMFESGRTKDQIIETMEICEDNYEDWAMTTVRMKIADVVGGKLKSKNRKSGGIVVLSHRDI